MQTLAPSERVVPEMEDTDVPVGRDGRAREEDKGAVEGGRADGFGFYKLIIRSSGRY